MSEESTISFKIEPIRLFPNVSIGANKLLENLLQHRGPLFTPLLQLYGNNQNLKNLR